MPMGLSFSQKLDKVVFHLSDDLNSVKTGRAKPSLVEEVKADAYGSQMTIKELASISAPDSHQIIISPWDKSLVEMIAKAINSADLNLNGVVDGDVVRINIPPLTGETRRQLIKLVKQKIESAKVMVRQVRASAKKEIESQKDDGGVGEDEIRTQLDELQKSVDDCEKRLDEMGKDKEEELEKI